MALASPTESIGPSQLAESSATVRRVAPLGSVDRCHRYSLRPRLSSGVGVGVVLPPPSEFGILRYLYTTVGIFVGVAQWLVLRLYLPRSGWWPVATAAGLLTGNALVGPLQCLILHRHVRKAGWWVLTSTLVWPFAMVIGTRVVLTLPHLVSHRGWAWSMMSLHALSGFIVGTLVGALTGLNLVKLLRRPISIR